jgi:hypothetical protein
MALFVVVGVNVLDTAIVVGSNEVLSVVPLEIVFPAVIEYELIVV